MSTARPITTEDREQRHELLLDDGTRLAYRAWAPDRPTRRAVLLFHRGHEHSGRLRALAEELRLEDRWLLAWDMRGHGESGGRGTDFGFARLVRDAEVFARELERRHGIELSETAVVANSLGALVATAWLRDCGPPLRALVLAAPAFRIRLFVPFAEAGLRELARLRPGARITSLVRGRWLTRDRQEARAYDEDPLVDRSIGTRLLLGSLRAGRRLVREAAALRTPTLVLAGSADRVVDLEPTLTFVGRLGARRRAFVRHEGMRHGLFHEQGRERLVQEIREFVLAADDFEAESPAVVAREEEERTRRELEALEAPLPALSLRSLGSVAARLGLQTAGRASRGIRIGLEHGFDSGVSLDHVYRDRAEGFGLLGRALDRRYLDAPGWRGIRERRVLLREALNRCLDEVADEGLPPRVLDVASGPGRYLLETLAERPEASARLRDFAPANVEAARELACELGLSERVVAERGDAFDSEALAAVEPTPSVAIVSGLLELFPDDELARRVLSGLAGLLPPGGRLIYTNQPRHPQLAVIARTLRNHRGRRWIMRCRSQAEMDALAAEAGFRKSGTLATTDGLFTVSVASGRVSRRPSCS